MYVQGTLAPHHSTACTPWHTHRRRLQWLLSKLHFCLVRFLQGQQHHAAGTSVSASDIEAQIQTLSLLGHARSYGEAVCCLQQ